MGEGGRERGMGEREEGEGEGGGEGEGEWGEGGREGERNQRRKGGMGWVRERKREGRENRIITTAHRFWFGWRCHIDCRILACLKSKERKKCGGVRQE